MMAPIKMIAYPKKKWAPNVKGYVILFAVCAIAVRAIRDTPDRTEIYIYLSMKPPGEPDG